MSLTKRILETSIAELCPYGLSERNLNKLVEHGLMHIRDFQGLTDQDILHWGYCGQQALKEIKKALRDFLSDQQHPSDGLPILGVVTEKGEVKWYE